MTNAYLEEMAPVIKEYLEGLSQEDFVFMKLRCKQNLCGDKGNVANMLSQNATIDDWLASATTAVEWFEMMRTVASFVKSEAIRRDQNKPERRNGRSR